MLRDGSSATGRESIAICDRASQSDRFVRWQKGAWASRLRLRRYAATPLRRYAAEA